MFRCLPIILLYFLIISSGLVGCADPDGIRIQETAFEVRTVTEAHTRVVWVQDTEELTDVFARGNQLRLMGYDSDDGRGERVILPGPANFSKPLITRGGDQVVFTDFDSESVHAVNWDGSGLRTLNTGLALAIWRDPDDGRDWVYVAQGRVDEHGLAYRKVIRHPLDDPDHTEPVWNRTHVGTDSFQLSADGTRASGVFPWPECGVARLTTGERKRYGRGCWASYTPDNSYRFWYFDGAHRNVQIVDEHTDARWQVSINSAEGMEGYEVYHPRWSNHPDFFGVTGPYKIRDGGNNIRGGGADVEIYIGRFNADMTEVEKWVRVTENPYANFYPDVWINPTDRPLPGQEEAATHKAEDETPEIIAWPVVQDGLRFIWEHREANNEITRDGETFTCEMDPVGHARYGRHYDMDLRQGHFKSRTPVELSTQNFSIEMLVTPTKNIPSSEGYAKRGVGPQSTTRNTTTRNSADQPQKQINPPRPSATPPRRGIPDIPSSEGYAKRGVGPQSTASHAKPVLISTGNWSVLHTSEGLLFVTHHHPNGGASSARPDTEPTINDPEQNQPTVSASRSSLLRQASGGQAALQDTEHISIAPHLPATPTHLVITVDDTHITTYLNGEPISVIERPEMDVASWSPQPLYVGGRDGELSNWSGYVEGLALYDRALTAQEVSDKASTQQARVAARAQPQTVTVKARLTDASQIPTPEAIAPYRRGLVVNEYEVVDVLDGALDEPHILVAHWVILDGQVLDTAQREKGTVYTMTLEPYDDRPELEGERLSMDSDNLLLTTYFDLDL